MERNATERERHERFANRVDRLAPLLALPLTPGRICSTAEVCIRGNISRTTLWRLQRDGILPKGRLTTDDVAAWLNARRVETRESRVLQEVR